ncbi:MAG: c-type cytochrome [Planctomycetes bacterium]|nr:c-type cytochrome [Planctomycetota bacterium]
MIRLRWPFVAMVLLGFSMLSAAEPLPRIPPKEPVEALKSFIIRDGFEMQLLATEPLVASPVAMEYDENGRAYVAEMRDYPYTDKASDKPFVERTKDEPLGRIRLLEDSDGDGRFDKSTIFAEGLSWPTGLALWKGGVYVVATPDLWYLKDTDGDGRADERRKVLTGFRKFNVQAVINNLKWGLDGKIYGAGSSNGGQIRRGDTPDAKSIAMTTADFRFDPRDEAGSFELLSGGARFGNSFDDWGNRFICNIRNPIQHVVLPRHYLARNPHLASRSPLNDVAESGDTVPVFRRSPPEPWRVMNARRLANDATLASPRSESVAAGYMTSAAGLTVYRGSAYPKELYGTIFLGEVAGNLIHHQVLKPDSVTFKSSRSEEGKEFLTSTDNWFRPVNFVNAPDGTLHVIDMYRETIEHPWSIPDDIKAQLDLESGRDRGRIYRLAPVGTKPSAPPKISNATTRELIGMLKHPNCWWRETAHRLLLERQDREAVNELRGLLFCPDRFPRTEQLHALNLLSSMDALSDSDVLSAMNRGIRTPGLLEHAVRLSEPRLAAQPELLDTVLRTAQDDSIRVRLQVAFSLGAVVRDSEGRVREPVVTALASIADRDAADDWLRTAVLSSSGEILPHLFAELIRQPRFGESAPQRQLARLISVMIGSRAQADELSAFFVAVETWATSVRKESSFVEEVTSGLGEGLKRSGKALSAELSASKSAGARRMLKRLENSLATLKSNDTPLTDRQTAVPLLAFLDFERARETLIALLQPRQPAELQAAAVRALAEHRHETVPKILLSAYRQLGAAARAEAVEALLSRPDWHVALLDAIDANTIKPSEIPHVRRNALVRSANAAVKERSVAKFRSLIESRQKVVDKYRDALPNLKSDFTKGEAIFRRECQACHRVNNIGTEIGPSLATIRHRAPEEVLLHILDPNREVGPNFVAYAVELNDGRVLTGLIVEDTASSITLIRATGTRETILRSNIEEIAATGQSLMPPGLEDRVTPQEMADLLAFLLPTK